MKKRKLHELKLKIDNFCSTLFYMYVIVKADKVYREKYKNMHSCSHTHASMQMHFDVNSEKIG